MRATKSITLFIVMLSLVSIVGCGISKEKYETLLNDKIILEEKVIVLTKSKDALKNEYDNLLKDKMDLATRIETMTNEKTAMKGEYDKILEEKITLKAAHDKLLAESKELQNKLSKR